MKTIRYAAILAAALAISAASAESLWTPTAKSMIADRKATQVGDIVTILVTETTSSSDKASSDFNRKLNHNTGAGVGPLAGLIPKVTATSAQTGSSGGSTSRSTTFTAQMTAKITKVLPNGNFEIEGARSVQTNSEKQDIKLTGTIRPEDIAPDNTIQSTYIADAKISSTGKGPIGDRQKEGIISRLLKILF